MGFTASETVLQSPYAPLTFTVGPSQLTLTFWKLSLWSFSSMHQMPIWSNIRLENANINGCQGTDSAHLIQMKKHTSYMQHPRGCYSEACEREHPKGASLTPYFWQCVYKISRLHSGSHLKGFIIALKQQLQEKLQAHLFGSSFVSWKDKGNNMVTQVTLSRCDGHHVIR